MKEEIKIEIPCYRDREKLISALANSGYKVRVKEEKGEHSWITHYFIVFETKQTHK